MWNWTGLQLFLDVKSIKMIVFFMEQNHAEKKQEPTGPVVKHRLYILENRYHPKPREDVL